MRKNDIIPPVKAKASSLGKALSYFLPMNDMKGTYYYE
jgi:hypothetical protein